MPVYTYTTLNDPSATTGTKAFGINDAGQIVGGYDAGSIGTVHGFLLSGGTYTTLDDPGTDQTQLSRINNAGEIAGFYFTPGIQGFQYINGSYFPIDDPLATATLAEGINDQGQIVGRYLDNDDVSHGFFYSGGLSGAYTTLDDPSATAIGGTIATGINDAGQIVGYYGNASGQHGFLAIPNGHGGYSYTTLDVPLATSTTASTMRARSSAGTATAPAFTPSSIAEAATSPSTIP
jgi:probable HAF family extracellular repeat protein